MAPSTPYDRRATVIAVMVVLGALGVGALGVAVAVVLGARTAAPAPVTSTAPTAGPTTGSAGPTGTGPSLPPPTEPDGPDESGSTTSVAREVLRDWDRRREAAWVAADTRALAALYLPDAVAGDRDLALLRRWTARGARVTRLQPQVLELRVVRDVGRTLVVGVTDRLAVEATVGQALVALPQDRPTTRRIVLRRGPLVTSPWRVASVRGAATLAAPGSLEE